MVPSDPRNASILKMLNLIGIGERAGSGVPDIFATWEQQGWKEPEVEEQYGPDRTILTLSFIKKVVEKSNNENENMVSDHDSDHVHSYEDQKQRLQEFCAVPRTRQEMQDFLGIASRGYFSRRFIVPMVNEGKLKLTIPDKPKSRNQKYIKA